MYGYGDTLTLLRYNAGRARRGREGFGEVRSIVRGDGRLALVKCVRAVLTKREVRRWNGAG